MPAERPLPASKMRPGRFAAKPLICSAALVRVQMEYPLSVAPRLQSEMLVRGVVGAPKQIHQFRRSLNLDARIIRHRSNLPRGPELPPSAKKQNIHAAKHATLPLVAFSSVLEKTLGADMHPRVAFQLARGLRTCSLHLVDAYETRRPALAEHLRTQVVFDVRTRANHSPPRILEGNLAPAVKSKTA